MATQNFGIEIRAARQALGLTQVELAKRFGTTAAVIASWERNETAPELPEVVRLALYGLECDEAGQDPEEFAAWCKSVNIDPSPYLR